MNLLQLISSDFGHCFYYCKQKNRKPEPAVKEQFRKFPFYLFFITKLRFEPFLSILIVAVILGLLLGLSPTNLIDSIEKGTGTLLGHLSLILALGAMFGKVLEELGAVDIASKKLINLFGVSKIQLGLLVARFYQPKEDESAVENTEE